MAYIFQEDELPKLVSVVPGRERTFFVILVIWFSRYWEPSELDGP